MPVLAVNKRANFDYEILDKYEAGIVLFGHEVKAVKNGQVSLRGGYVTFKRKSGRELPEIYLTNVHISKYKYASAIEDYNPERPRKLLLNKKEIKYLVGKKQEQGLTLIPIKIYTKHSLIKVEFGVGRGKKKYDKREDIKKREIEKRIKLELKNKSKSARLA